MSRYTRTAVRAVMGAVMAVAGTIAVLPGAAQAAYTCPDGWLCIYKDYNATGTVSVQPRLNPASGGGYTGIINDFRNSHYSNGDSLNDSASSVVNNTDYWMFLFEHGHTSGMFTIIRPRSGTTNLNNVMIYTASRPLGYGSLNDVATSAVVGSCTSELCQ